MLQMIRLFAHVVDVLKYPKLAVIRTPLQLALRVPFIIAALNDLPDVSLTQTNSL